MADIRESERDSAQLKMSEELQSIKFFQRKVEEYKDRIRYLKEELSDVGYSEELCHQKLVDRSKEIDSLAKSVEKLDLHLESFKGFPTDYNLAKVKLAEEKQILAEWQKKLMETVTKPSD